MVWAAATKRLAGWIELTAAINFAISFLDKTPLYTRERGFCCSDLLGQEFLNYYRFIVFFVAGAVEEGGGFFLCQGFELFDWFGVAAQLLFVALLELRPFLGIVVKPFAQFSAGRNILQPEIQFGTFFRNAARPEPVHQYARTIGSLGRLVNSFE